MQQDRTGFENPERFWAAAIDQRRDLGVRIDVDEAGTELLAVDPDQPGVIFRLTMAECQQLLEHDRDLLAVRRRQRIKLERMAADWQFLLMGRAGDRAGGRGNTG